MDGIPGRSGAPPANVGSFRRDLTPATGLSVRRRHNSIARYRCRSHRRRARASLRMRHSVPVPTLLDRVQEKEALDELLGAVRAGLSGAAVLLGEAGVGKTALLDYVAASAAAEMDVVRVVGNESETELGFAALHQLVVPFLGRLEGLPIPQREALGSAFGLIEVARPADLFLIGLAALTLLADAASERPVLCVIDDAQWVDQASARVLGFVARRLLADRVGMLFAVREESGRPPGLERLAELHVKGLPESEAHLLLSSVAASGLEPQVRERVVLEARGNPLALLELGRELAEERVSVSASLGQPLPIDRRLEQRFLSRVRSLPVKTQSLLLLAAAEQLGDPAAAVAGRRAARDRPARRGAARALRSARRRAAGRVPSPADALGRLPGRFPRGSPPGPRGAGGSHRPRARPRPPRLAPRRSSSANR